MRWRELFEDLEGQAQSLERLELDSEIADRTRAEIATVRLINRLRAQVGQPVVLVLAGVGELRGQLQRVGSDWLLVETSRETVIPLDAVVMLKDLTPMALSEEGVDLISSRLSLRAVLRAVARDRSPVVVRLIGGGSITGTLERVGADFVDLSEHDLDVAPRPQRIRSRATVPFAAIASCQRTSPGWVNRG